ncbi:ABC transporter permease [Nocardioides mangrovicus]|uniref:ABC transporter permease n=1 Tax=Nocardioides mangrovicus TaxID=2478913 RepID=A0A3L8P5C4_9ACTN|nr:ABC transporter permease [Nocardioides mangrovicus]
MVLAVVAWWLVSLVMTGAKQVPSPAATLHAAVVGFTEHDLLLDLRLSVLRVLIGVAIGCAVAVPVGFVLAWYRPLRLMFEPLVSFFRALPPIALIPLVIVYLGIGEQARLSVLSYAAFFAAVVVIYESVAAVDDIYVRAGRAMGASGLELFARIVVPYTVPQVFVAVRVALGIAWATLVAAELTVAQRGLGTYIQDAANFSRKPDLFAGIVLIGLSAVVMDRVLVAVMRVSVRWQDRVAR